MGKVLRVDIVADAKKVGPGVAQAESKFGKLGKAGKIAGAAAAAGLAVAGAAAIKFGGDAIGAASDVQQSFGALDTVFGKSSARVKKWAEGAAESVGLSKSSYAELSSLVGSQLQGMGTAQDKSAKKSDELIRLGADLAATYGGSVADAVGAVSSVLKGETDPIERYGVSIKAADVNARMAAMGLDGLTGKAAKQAQAQATLALLTEQTSRAQGAFGRESNTLAGQQERLRAKVDNLKASLGAKLLPAATAVTGWLSNKLLPAASRLGANLSEKLGPAFRRVGEFIQTRAIPAARQVQTWFVDKIAPGLKRTVMPIVEAVRGRFTQVGAALEKNRPQIEKLLAAFRKIAEFIAGRVMPIVGKVIALFVNLTTKAFTGAINGAGKVVDVFDNIRNAISRVIDWIGKIKWPKPPAWLSKVGGALNPFAAQVAVGAPQLVGEAPSYDRRRSWTSAALSPSSSWSAALAGAVAAPAGPAYVDARTIVNVTGALDPDAVARQIEQLLERRARRLGRPVLAGVGR